MTQQFEFSYQECEACTEARNIIKTDNYFAGYCLHAPTCTISMPLIARPVEPCKHFKPKEKPMTEKTFDELLATPYALIGKDVFYEGDRYTVCGDDRVVNPDSEHLFLIRNEMVRVWALTSRITEWKEPEPTAKRKVKHFKIFYKAGSGYIQGTFYHPDVEVLKEEINVKEKDIITIEEREFEI